MSVVDKADIDVFARALSEEFGAQILSMGATARFLTEAGVPITAIDDVAKLAETVDMVVVNLGVFDETVADAAESGAGVEAIDIDGSSVLRSAAKNHESITAVTDPESYESILAEMRENEGATTLGTRRRLALDAFRVTGAYDTAVSIWIAGKLDGVEQFPEKMNIQLFKQQDLRYGENPHQTAAFYRRSTATA
ncbi:MAG: bifunctional phosphoribosylaminoimidazolecarboxamide formyltransferase/IMP cyclohydrolase, partial [Eggerthellaceae bacterium]|nr:bifunctional phosphoribosylaminoimidazolecarboxamide formyltransferase/IMP cyclohydrolase [Eggerthellaceae bacterium]